MSRLLFWLALAFLVVAALRSKLRALTPKDDAPPARGPGARAHEAELKAEAKAEPKAETMACCAHCGVYFPASEAVRADGLDYCSPAHVRLPPV